jgi:hypothetical protein
MPTKESGQPAVWDENQIKQVVDNFSAIMIQLKEPQCQDPKITKSSMMESKVSK